MVCGRYWTLGLQSVFEDLSGSCRGCVDTFCCCLTGSHPRAAVDEEEVEEGEADAEDAMIALTLTLTLNNISNTNQHLRASA
jgi:hypothetical protein